MTRIDEPLPASRARTFAPGCRVCFGTGRVHVKQGLTTVSRECECWRLADQPEPTTIKLEGLQTGNADLVPSHAPACPYCLGKGVQQQAAPGASLMCVRCLGTGTVQP